MKLKEYHNAKVALRSCAFLPHTIQEHQVDSGVWSPHNRHEYYQKPEEVVVAIFAKGIPAYNVIIDFGERLYDYMIWNGSLPLYPVLFDFLIFYLYNTISF